MISVLLSLLSPEAVACSEIAPQPVASFPDSGAVDTALNQRLIIEYNGGFNIQPPFLEAYQVDGDALLLIEGEMGWTCANGNLDRGACFLTFLPESGSWPMDSSISWQLAAASGGPIVFSGDFQTTDWLSAGAAPLNSELQGEWLDWIEADGMCTFQDSLSGSFDFSASSVEGGSVLELWMEGEGESVLVGHEVIVQGGEVELELPAFVLASTAEYCFEVSMVGPDGVETGSVEGPCLQWSQHDPIPNEAALDRGWLCATASNGGRTAGFFLGLMGLVTVIRRRR
jgi:MYXO-CTERM domain-containing protein